MDAESKTPAAPALKATIGGMVKARAFGLVFAGAIVAYAVLLMPREAWGQPFSEWPEASVFAVLMAGFVLVANEIWVLGVRRWLSVSVRYGVLFGFATTIIYSLIEKADGFNQPPLVQVWRWFDAAGPVELWGLGLGAAFVLLGVGMSTLLTPQARNDGEMTRWDQRLIATGLPVMVGEGAMLILIVLARQLDWSAPGAIHGAVLFFAGAAFLAAIWFCAVIYGRMDEQQRNLTYRVSTTTFLVFFFVLAGWALCEAIGITPRLDAFAAFLLLNAVYLAIGVPWALWHQRHELFADHEEPSR